jgi:hypothetical protein
VTQNWICIYSSKEMYKVEIVKAVLFDNNIDSVVVNMQDSSYHFGDVELHVQPDDVISAKQIINNNNL